MLHQRAFVIALFLLALALCSPAQNTKTLSLEEAEKLATQNHPRIAAAGANAQAAGSIVAQVKSAFQPLVTANLTTAGVDRDTTIAAGTLQTSGLASRAATGLGVSQLITDFGRTSNLADSARLRAAAQQRNVDTTRAQILLQVDQASYAGRDIAPGSSSRREQPEIDA
jgi:outer membrane protein